MIDPNIKKKKISLHQSDKVERIWSPMIAIYMVAKYSVEPLINVILKSGSSVGNATT